MEIIFSIYLFMNFLESYSLFSDIFDGKKSSEEIEDILRSLAENGESFEEIAGAAQAMREHATEVVVPFETFDVCGTGGSAASKAFNVSTTVAFILASAGVKVAKHGNRAASSKSGSADVLESLGAKITLSPQEMQKNLVDHNLSFLFAQVLHPAMKNLMPIRKKIGSRTIFNLLGPLTNPTNPTRQLVGVSDQKYIIPMIEAMKLLGKKSAMVVWGEDGLDEVTLRGNTFYAKLSHDGTITQGKLFPEQFGISSISSDMPIAGGPPDENAKIITALLQNVLFGSERDLLLLNAGIAFWVAQKTASIEEGIALAEKQIITGEAYALLNTLR